MNLHWHVTELATVLHVAAASARGLPLANKRLAAAVAGPAAAIQDEIRRAGVPSDEAWSALCAASCQHDLARDAVQAALPVIDQEAAAHQGGPAREDRVTRLLGEVRAEIHLVLPGLKEELRHRGRPLREQWDARGPGFLHHLRELTDDLLCLEEADLFLLIPILGGGGGIDPAHGAVRIEALLANTVPGLPEVVRLGWLLAQLACYHALNLSIQQPAGQTPPCETTQPSLVFHRGFNFGLGGSGIRQNSLGNGILANSTTRKSRSDGLLAAIALAMVPATLAAAEAVELVACDAETVHRATAAWQHGPAASGSAGSEQARHAWDWWQARQSSTPWERAVVELNARLRECDPRC